MRIYNQLPLPNPGRSIRLATIKPGWPADIISVELSVVPDRDKAPPYDALSYVWGSTSCTDVILCNGSLRAVTKNLVSALRALRPLPATGDLAEHGIHVIDENHMLHSTRRAWNGFARNRYEPGAIESRRMVDGVDQDAGLSIWIDALCINQNDLTECSEQVKGMREIYGSARQVHIWLGNGLTAPSGARLDIPIQKASMLNRILGHVRLAECGHMPVVLSFLAHALSIERAFGAKYDPKTADKLPFGFPSMWAPEWLILKGFFDRDWFRRVWIVQEIAMAQEAIILIGDWEIDWEPFTRAVKMYKLLGTELSQSVRTFSTFGRESIFYGIPLDPALYLCDISQVSPLRSNHLFDLLASGYRRKASKSVDYIYALLGIANQVVHLDQIQPPSGWSLCSLSSLIDIDYTKPLSLVYRDVTIFVILTHNALLPFNMVEYPGNEETSNTPSWVPSWNRTPRSPLFWLDGESAKAFHTDLGRRMEVTVNQQLNELHVGGYLLEDIKAISVPLRQSVAGNELVWYPPKEEEIHHHAIQAEM
ncbi:hypothetical protein NW766_009648 [Fusarium irregulare]|uniref:Heterokaryon incompatibility domain-containing protein n=1 Tax=Fusarium irregulare TaxID=2494466 RepID=A0A9W8PJ64_9HYPO|nr:hypothetical protein NW766_009648 [Fusarium irregulare]